MLQSVVINSHFNSDDLAELPALEMVVADDVARESAVEMDCTEDNADDAYTGWWDCDHCRRVRLVQTGDLEVTLPRDLDLQQATLDNWFVSARLAPLLEAHGVRLRPLKGRDDYQQVACGPVAVRPDVWPVESEDTCPHCGRPQVIERQILVEGRIMPRTYEGVNIIRNWSVLTLLTEEFVPALGRVNLSFVRVPYMEGQEAHYVGQPILPGDLNVFTLLTSAYHLASQSLCRALLEAEATGLKFLPVNPPTS